MGPKVNCPFRTASHLVEEMKDETDAIIVEIHAETTSEKEAMGWHLDGKAPLAVRAHTCCVAISQTHLCVTEGAKGGRRSHEP